MIRRTWFVGAVVAFSLPAAWWLMRAPAPIVEPAAPTSAPAVLPSRSPVAPTTPLDVTFLVAADTHLGFDTPDRDAHQILANPIGIEKTNLRMIVAMNELPGVAYPEPLGGSVNAPRGVLVAGDLTEDGGQVDWIMFEALYGRTGKEGPLKYPVFEGAGNHDLVRDWVVRDRIRERHGGWSYSFDFDGLHFVCLDEAPGEEGLAFLENDLGKHPSSTPIVLYFHFPLLGPFRNNWFGKSDYPDRFHSLIEGRNVVGIFHGHNHASGAYRWRGFDVYNVGSPKHSYHSFAVVQVTSNEMKVASYNYDLDEFWWWHRKPLGRAAAATTDEQVIGQRATTPGVPTPKLNL